MRAAKMKRVKTEEGGVVGSSEMVRLNVGGVHLDCSLATLTNYYPDSMLAVMFQERNRANIPKDENGRFWIESDGLLFGQILHYIRRSIPFSLLPPNTLKEIWQIELDYWGLSLPVLVEDEPEINLVESILSETEQRMDGVIHLLMQITDIRAELLKGESWTYIYLPYGEYQTEWGQSLSQYLSKAKELFEKRLKKMMSFHSLRIDQKSMAKTTAKYYSFNGVQFNTHTTSSMEILIIRNL